MSTAKINNTSSANATTTANGNQSSIETRAKKRTATGEVKDITTATAAEKTEPVLTGEGDEPTRGPKREKRTVSAEVQGNPASVAPDDIVPALAGEDKDQSGRAKRHERNASIEAQEIAASGNGKQAPRRSTRRTRNASFDIQETATTQSCDRAVPTATDKTNIPAAQGIGKKRTAAGELKSGVEEDRPTVGPESQPEESQPAKKPRLTGKGRGRKPAAGATKKLASAAITTFPDGTPLATNQIITPWEELKFDQKKPAPWGVPLLGVTEQQFDEDLGHMDVSTGERKRITSIKEPILVDGATQRPFGGAYGASVPGTGVKPPAPKRTSGRGNEKYQPLRLSQGWVLFDPHKGFPAQWPNIPPQLHRFSHYKPGNARILKYSLGKNGSVASCATPEMLKSKAVDYGPAGPKLVNAPPPRSEEVAVDALPTFSEPVERAEPAEGAQLTETTKPTAPLKYRKGKGKAAQTFSEPLPIIEEELPEDILPSVERITAETAVLNSWPKTSPSKAPATTSAASERRSNKRQRSESVVETAMPAPKRTMRQTRPLPEKNDLPALAGKEIPSAATSAAPEQPSKKRHRSESVVAADEPGPKRSKRQARPLPEKREMPARAGKGQRKNIDVEADTPAPELEEEVPAVKHKVKVVRKDSAVVVTADGETVEKKRRTRKPSKPKITPALVVEDSE